MRQQSQCNTWVVYRMTAIVSKKPTEVNVVCEQVEWEGLYQKKPNAYALVRSGIATEEEAEKFARGTSGNASPRAERTSFGELTVRKSLESSSEKSL